MAARLLKTATSNAFSTTLNGSVAAGDTSITLTTTSGLQAPGIIIINRQDANGTNTPNAREYVSFTGITSNTLTGCTRGLGGSTAQAHASDSLVEEVFSVTHWNDLLDYLDAEHNSDGTHDDTIVAKLAGAQTFTGIKTFNAAAIFSKATKNTLVTNTDGATVTFDLDAGNIHTVTLAGNRTLAVSNEDAGQCFIIRLKQDATGSRTVTWFTGISWADGSAPTLTTTANKTDVFGFICTAGGAFDGFIVGANV